MISVRLNAENKVTAWAAVLNEVNPFDDGILVDAEVSFMEENYGVHELTLVDGALVIGDEVPPIQAPKTPDQLRIEDLEAQLSVLNTNNIEFMEMILQTLGVE